MGGVPRWNVAGGIMTGGGESADMAVSPRPTLDEIVRQVLDGACVDGNAGGEIMTTSSIESRSRVALRWPALSWGGAGFSLQHLLQTTLDRVGTM